jgi:hypothetical protein
MRMMKTVMRFASAVSILGWQSSLPLSKVSVEVRMNNNTSLRFLTWGTALAALGGAVLLSGEDAGVPDVVARAPFTFHVPTDRRPEPARSFNLPHREAPAAARHGSSGAR